MIELIKQIREGYRWEKETVKDKRERDREREKARGRERETERGRPK